jgi:hypothetical protein
MATLENRLLALEAARSTMPWAVMDVDGKPTPDQQTEIDRCTRTGRMLVVFYEPGNTAWVPGLGEPAPWDCDHGQP